MDDMTILNALAGQEIHATVDGRFYDIVRINSDGAEEILALIRAAELQATGEMA